MFNEKNPLHYSSNKDLERPEPENEDDFVGELHTATSVIAKVEDEEGAQEIVRRVNMHDELLSAVQLMRDVLSGKGNINKRSTAFAFGSNKTYYTILNNLLKKAEQK